MWLKCKKDVLSNPQSLMKTEKSTALQTHRDGRRESVLNVPAVFYGGLQKVYLEVPQNVARLDRENM